MYTLLIDREPVSVNGAKHHLKYETELKQMMQEKYPLTEGHKYHYEKGECLYLQMWYIYKRQCARDIDNIIKYTMDSFTGFLYKNDRQIKYVASQAVAIKDGKISSIELTQFEEDVASGLMDFMLNDDRDRKSCTYIECGVMNDKFNKVNLEKIWR